MVEVRIIARSRKRGEARYSMVGKEEQPNDGRRRLAGREGREGRREEAKKKGEGGKKRSGSLRHDL